MPLIGRRASDSAFPDRQYSRCNHSAVDAVTVKQLTVEKWLRIFEEADRLGISFILLAGGKPMIRRDIIEAAGTYPNILFPVFTNGSFMRIYPTICTD